ncbi:anoctamin-10-like isoform X1 [Mya arenaria]|uniref:anoctamin-10-like isoform X1 n=1 Tax=Mya arenaria TaxID=6604 RepID=UPI0022E56F45|nr:anoctamin-10-like isoform X1 [Mya arenaria]XP_052816112.1 anoctamin-10-like isoform X1 [Mya arenaria]XP_052816113.1 anoctamin-10-like isoform X1 [Mya arenaria]
MEEVGSATTTTTAGGAGFEPLEVLEFAVNTKQAAIEWMIAKLQAPADKSGADLCVSAMVMQHNQETVLFIGGSTSRLLLGAEMMDMMKEYKDGNQREFTVEDISNFRGGENPDMFLTMAEKQKIIFRELENIRATDSDEYVPGYEFIKLYQGRTIVKKLLSADLIKNLFPIHDQEFLKKMGADWYKKPVASQPIEKIQHYFGEKIALYFAFLGFYTVALIPPAILGVLYWITSWQNLYREALFAVFNLVWATIFLEAWKRYCAELAFKWGCMDFVSTNSEEPRANYHGRMGKNPVTGKPEPVFPKSQQYMRFYGVTVPVLCLCLTVAFYAMLGYFWLQAKVDKWYLEDKSWLNLFDTFMPTVVYAIVIAILNAIYRKVAVRLNEFENHRLQTSYDNNMILKLIMFEFINCFMSLFYVAFYLQDMRLLKSHLAALLITTQLLGQIQESILPFLFHRRRANRLDKAMSKFDTLQKVEFYNGEVSTDLQKQVSIESTMDVYNGTLDDYLEMFLQFGYVFLFSSVFPLAAVWALLNNFTEIRSDAFKMCRVFQRPFAESASNIGAWQIAFEVVSVMAVMTNCALIGMNPEVQKLLPSDITAVNIVIVFVAIEHLLLAVRVSVAYFIPDVPGWVEIEMAKIAYQSKLALQKEQLARNLQKKRHEVTSTL